MYPNTSAYNRAPGLSSHAGAANTGANRICALASADQGPFGDPETQALSPAYSGLPANSDTATDAHHRANACPNSESPAIPNTGADRLGHSQSNAIPYGPACINGDLGPTAYSDTHTRPRT